MRKEQLEERKVWAMVRRVWPMMRKELLGERKVWPMMRKELLGKRKVWRGRNWYNYKRREGVGHGEEGTG